MIDATFSTAVGIVLDHEGLYQCDPHDAGNWTGGKVGGGEMRGTNMGISARQYPNLDIKALTRDQAVAIYFTDVWTRYRLGQLPDAISPKVFDAAVLCGPGTAIRLLQQAAAALGASCATDGSIGPQTCSACRGVPADRLLAMYRGLLVQHFEAIVRAKPGQQRFLAGWKARALA